MNLLLEFLLLNYISNDYNSSNFKSVVEQIGDFYKFSTIAIFVEPTAIDDSQLNWILQYTNLELKTTHYLTIGNNENVVGTLRDHVSDDTLCVVFCASDKDAIWHMVDKSLRRLRQAKLIIILAGNCAFVDIRLIFEMLWNLQFTNALVQCKDDRTFTYTPFPKMRVLEVHNIADSFFAQNIKQLNGYTISTPVYNDIPRIFCITDSEGQIHFKGFAYQIFKHFLQRLNASLHISNPKENRSILKSVNMSRIIYEIGRKELEISMHPYTGINQEIGTIGYPIFKLINCLIVPVQNEIPRFMYLVRPFEWSSWIMIVIAIFYVTFIMIWANPFAQSEFSMRGKIGRALLESLTHIFFLPPCSNVNRPTLRYFLIYLLLTLLGYFVTTWYCNLLSSFYTTFLVGRQIDSFGDLIAAKLPLMAKKYEVQYLLPHVPKEHLKQFKALIVPVDASVMVAHMLSFNTSYAYHVTEERWKFLALQQQYANKPLYRFSSICFGRPTIGYPMRLDSHLQRHMTQFIMEIQMGGLDHHWLISDFKEALKAGYVRLLNNVLPFKPLNVKDSLRLVFYFLIIGYCFAIGIFMLEIFSLI